MDGTPFPRADAGRAFLLTALLLLARSGAGAVALGDGPVVWYEDDRRPVPVPEVRDPDLLMETYLEACARPLDRLCDPVRNVRRLGALLGGGDHAPQAGNVNALDEVPNSSWFTNRIGLLPWTPEQAAAGPAGRAPDRSAPWTIVGAKVGGVTPGFRIEDARGDRYLIKFDPPGHVGMTIRAGVVSNLILHSAGYNVPRDRVVAFRRDDLSIGEGASIRLEGGRTVVLTAANLDSLLGAPHAPDGRWFALASRFLDGIPLGPFDYRGRRADDPNDRVSHEHRRELRALRMLAAWINHFDTKPHNSLDVYVGEPGAGHVVHYLIDFASTLGAGGRAPNPKWGWEYGIDPSAILGRTLALGLHEDHWPHQERPANLAEVGYFAVDRFDPIEWKPYIPNSAFANLTGRDGYWAAKIVSAFTDAHLQAIVAEAAYQDPASAAHVVRTLAERRKILVRHWFERVPPLDHFAPAAAGLAYHDLGVERGVFPRGVAQHRHRWAVVDAGRRAERWGEWRRTTDTLAPWPGGTPPAAGRRRDGHAYLACQVQVDRGEGWSPAVTVYLTADGGRVVAVER